MESQTLSARGLIKQGWQAYALRPWFYTGSIALVTIIMLLVQAILGSTESFIASVLIYIISIWITLGTTRFYLNATDPAKKASVKDFFMEYKPIVWLRYFVVSLITGIVVLIGLVLLIIPGIYIALRLSLVQYFLVDKQETIFGSMNLSWQATKGHTWKIFLFSILAGLCILLGLLLLGVGVLVAMPVTGLAFTCLYRKLALGQVAVASNEDAPVTPSAPTA